MKQTGWEGHIRSECGTCWCRMRDPVKGRGWAIRVKQCGTQRGRRCVSSLRLSSSSSSCRCCAKCCCCWPCADDLFTCVSDNTQPTCRSTNKRSSTLGQGAIAPNLGLAPRHETLSDEIKHRYIAAKSSVLWSSVYLKLRISSWGSALEPAGSSRRS